jgi:hypothetical protein
MAEHAEAAGRITEPPGNLDGGEPFDEIGAQGLVLAMGGVGGLEEHAGEISCLIWCIDKHIATMLHKDHAVKG